MRWRDRIVGVVLGLLIGVGALIFFVFGFSGESVDVPSLDTPNGGAAATTTAAAPEPEILTIEVIGGEPRGGVAELGFHKGERIRFVVRSDAAEEIHVHGYDVTADVPAGGKAELSFPAEFEGIFEIELHGNGALIAELTVEP